MRYFDEPYAGVNDGRHSGDPVDPPAASDTSCWTNPGLYTDPTDHTNTWDNTLYDLSREGVEALVPC
jgi:hypothetical protein